jgi:hypothetical protein
VINTTRQLIAISGRVLLLGTMAVVEALAGPVAGSATCARGDRSTALACAAG